MRHEVITLPETGVEMELYLTDNRAVEPERRRALALIFPGGAYAWRSDREAEPVALRLLGLGIQAAVVRYSVAPARYPKALQEAAEAVAYARAHAEEWLCDPHRIAVLGFSAGGHAAAHVGLKWHQMPQGKACRPDAMILCYPVITTGEYAHRGSVKNLLGEEENGKEEVSLENFVREDTPPVFLWHTREDGSVPVENSLLLAGALSRHGIDFELHIWQHGGHGMSLASDQVYPAGDGNIRPECQEWIEMAARWLLKDQAGLKQDAEQPLRDRDGKILFYCADCGQSFRAEPREDPECFEKWHYHRWFAACPRCSREVMQNDRYWR